MKKHIIPTVSCIKSKNIGGNFEDTAKCLKTVLANWSEHTLEQPVRKKVRILTDLCCRRITFFKVSILDWIVVKMTDFLKKNPFLRGKF